MFTCFVDHGSSHECGALVNAWGDGVGGISTFMNPFLSAVESAIYNLSEVSFTPSSQF